MDDADTRRIVLAALEADERLSSQPLEVEVSQGRVTLTGRVQSSRRKLAAQEIAAAVARSMVIDNQIEVAVPDNRLDDEIAQDVRAILGQQEGLAKQTVVVEVRAGRVTLSGSVLDEPSRRLAEDVALQVPGAREVANHLVIGPGVFAEAAVVGRELEYVLANAAELEGCAFRLALSGSVGVLSGTAESRLQIEHAVRLVRELWTGELRSEVTIAD